MIRLKILTFFLFFAYNFFNSQFKEISENRIKIVNEIYYFHNKPLNGKYKIYNRKNRNQVYYISNFDNGVKNDSQYVSYYFGETDKGQFINGLKEGIWTTTQKDGKVKETAQFEKNKRNGYSYSYSYNWKDLIIDTLFYKNDKLEGWQKIKNLGSFTKKFYEEGELKQSISKYDNGSFYNNMKYIKILGEVYSYGKTEKYIDNKKIVDSSVVNYKNNIVEKIIYSKINDSLYHKINYTNNENTDGVTVKFYDKNNNLYLKYSFGKSLQDDYNFIVQDENTYLLYYNNELKILKVKLKNSCKIWERIDNLNFTAYTYDGYREVQWEIFWLPSDGDMLANKCVEEPVRWLN